jgi:hypothetical protein
MRKVLNKVILFALVFGIIITIFPKANAEELNNEESENEVINDAIENTKFYSSFNYQTLTQDKLNKLTTDFYLPVEYFGVTISYIVDSEYNESAKYYKR